MDELDLIRSFGRSDATPNPLARTAARDRLLAHIADDPTIAASSAQSTRPSTTRRADEVPAVLEGFGMTRRGAARARAAHCPRASR